MKQAIGWLLASMVCACTAVEPPPPIESLASITARMDVPGGAGRSLEGIPAALDAWLKQHPDSAEAWIQYARYHLKSGHRYGRVYEDDALVAAYNALDRAEKLAPGDPDIDTVRGHVVDLLGWTDDAETIFARAEQHGADASPWFRLYRAEFHQHQGRTTDAKRDCDNVAARKNLSPLQRLVADECRRDAYWAQGDLAMTEHLFRQQLLYADDDAWLHGNFAQFLLCERDDPKSALVEVRRARALMDYGIARKTEAAAQVRAWSMQLAEGASTVAAATFDAASKLSPQPVEAYLSACYESPATRDLVRKAIKAGVLPDASEVDAISAAMYAEEHRDNSNLLGVYRMRVQSQAREGDVLMLGSAPDARGADGLTLWVTDDVQAQWRKTYGTSADKALMGQEIRVIGEPHRIRIDTGGTPATYATRMRVDAPQSILWAGDKPEATR